MPRPVSPLRSVSALLGRAFVLLASVGALNLFVDPFGTHGTNLIEPIVVSSRQPKLNLYRRASPPPEVVVLGSSRSFDMEPSSIERITGGRAFNAAVQAADPRDYEDFAACFERAGSFPSLLIVGLGIEELLEAGGPPAEPRDPLAVCRATIGAVPRSLRTLESTFSMQETTASVRSLLLEAGGRREPMNVFGSDGALRRTRPPTLGVDEAVDESLAGNWSPRRFAADSLARASFGHLDRLFETSRRHDARVVVYLPPYHPRALLRYRAESHFVSLHRQLLTQLADWQRRYSVDAQDFTEVAAFGGTSDMFYDASHPNEEACRLMTGVIARGLR